MIDAKFVRAFYDRVAPGIHSDYDGPQMLPLIAPGRCLRSTARKIRARRVRV